MEDFTRNMDVPYIGNLKLRYLLIGRGRYVRVATIAKINSDLTNGFSLLYAIRNQTSNQNYLVVDSNGDLVGGSQGVQYIIGDIQSRIGRPISTISSILAKAT